MDSGQRIIQYHEPMKVNTLEWAFNHLGCDALVVDEDDAVSMKLIAYVTNKNYNDDLVHLQDHIPNSIIFKNLSESEVDSIDSV